MKSKKGLVFIGLGFELAILIVGALLIGKKIDEIYDLKGLGLVGIIVSVFISWFVHFYVLVKRMMPGPEAADQPLDGKGDH